MYVERELTGLDGYTRENDRMPVPIQDVERRSPGRFGKAIADRRRTTLTRHQNHHVGTQPPPPGGYSLSPFPRSGPAPPGGPTSAPAMLQHAPSYPGYYVDTHSQVQGLGIPPLPSPSEFGGHSLSAPNPLGYSQPPHLSQPSMLMYGQEMTPMDRPYATPLQPPPQSYHSSRSSYRHRTASEDSAVRSMGVNFNQPPSQYDFRWQPDLRPQQYQTQPTPHNPLMPYPPQGQRRAAGQMDPPEDTEDERGHKRRRSDGQPPRRNDNA
jgi:hypothetical protein